MNINFLNSQEVDAKIRLIPRSGDAQITTLEGDGQWLVEFADGVVGFCLGANMPISCAGATQQLILAIFIRDDIDLNSEFPPYIEEQVLNIGQNSKLYIDGAYVSNIDDLSQTILEDNEVTMGEQQLITVPDGYQLEGVLKLTHSSSEEDLRISIDITAYNQDKLMLLQIFGNPTAGFDNGDQRIVTACLAPSEPDAPSQITCDGATHALVIELDGFSGEIMVGSPLPNGDTYILYSSTSSELRYRNDASDFAATEGYTVRYFKLQDDPNYLYGRLVLLNHTGDDKRLVVEIEGSWNSIDILEDISTPTVSVTREDYLYTAQVCLAHSEWFECAGATESIIVGPITSGGMYEIIVNDEELGEFHGAYIEGSWLPNIRVELANRGLLYVPLDENFDPVDTTDNSVRSNVQYVKISNTSNANSHLSIILSDANSIQGMYKQDELGINSAFSISDSGSRFDVCLSPAASNYCDSTLTEHVIGKELGRFAQTRLSVNIDLLGSPVYNDSIPNSTALGITTTEELVDWIFESNLGGIADFLEYEFADISNSSNTIFTIHNKVRTLNRYTFAVSDASGVIFNLTSRLCPWDGIPRKIDCEHSASVAGTLTVSQNIRYTMSINDQMIITQPATITDLVGALQAHDVTVEVSNATSGFKNLRFVSLDRENSKHIRLFKQNGSGDHSVDQDTIEGAITVYPSQVHICLSKLTPMILRNAYSSELRIYSGTELDIDWGMAIPTSSDSYTDEDSGTLVYMYTGQVDFYGYCEIQVMPKVIGQRIEFFGCDQFVEIKQWYSAGYSAFGYDGLSIRQNGIGTSIASIPDVQPPNTVNYAWMFGSSYYFNQNINHWNMSRAKVLTGMMGGCLYYSHTLENWCVPNITSYPEYFAGGQYEPLEERSLRESQLPVWGTCPTKYTIEKFERPKGAMTLRGSGVSSGNIMTITSYSPLEVTWHPELTVVTNREEMNLELLGDLLGDLLEDPSIYVYQAIMDHDKRHAAMAYVRHAQYDLGEPQIKGLAVTGFYEIVDWYEPGYERLGLGYFDQASSTGTTGVGFGITKVPDHPPLNTTNLNSLFAGSNFFNQDISNWEVGHVTSMDYMLYSSYSFKRDLSNWCVGNVFPAPYIFWTVPQLTPQLAAQYEPVWGTCPNNDYFVPNPPSQLAVDRLEYSSTIIEPRKSVNLYIAQNISRTVTYAAAELGFATVVDGVRTLYAGTRTGSINIEAVIAALPAIGSTRYPSMSQDKYALLGLTLSDVEEDENYDINWIINKYVVTNLTDSEMELIVQSTNADRIRVITETVVLPPVDPNPPSGSSTMVTLDAGAATAVLLLLNTELGEEQALTAMSSISVAQQGFAPITHRVSYMDRAMDLPFTGFSWYPDFMGEEYTEGEVSALGLPPSQSALQGGNWLGIVLAIQNTYDTPATYTFLNNQSDGMIWGPVIRDLSPEPSGSKVEADSTILILRAVQVAAPITATPLVELVVNTRDGSSSYHDLNEDAIGTYGDIEITVSNEETDPYYASWLGLESTDVSTGRWVLTFYRLTNNSSEPLWVDFSFMDYNRERFTVY